ncbi:hypothetical protein [Arthrobacter sp. MMS18-M83]|uniref:hypothetical protein n=1 Tax=Arthrobacter sp. MMS18-M83 TaxID=2996261 RepID=UPI00227B8F2D|nr:hypothetical protein [Arthrobacter sp. MMS18-M83]WAH98105.1 hypothetical protein OW521_04275 [Arthrobacter sp. MMS18-M83]
MTFHTSGLDLASRGITLRRRTGGTDRGWYLKIPQGPDRLREIQAPLANPRPCPRN